MQSNLWDWYELFQCRTKVKHNPGQGGRGTTSFFVQALSPPEPTQNFPAAKEK